MKTTLILCLFCFLTFNSFSQGIEGVLITNEKHVREIKSKGLQVYTEGVSADVAEVFKESLNKYWTATKIKYCESTAKPDPNQISLVLGNYSASGKSVAGKHTYSYSEIFLTNVSFGWFNNAFDNLKTEKTSYGIIKSNEELKFILPVYIKGFCAMYNLIYNNYEEKKSKWAFAGYGNFIDSLKMSTILIPNEYFSNGLSKASFDAIKNKEYLSLNDIGKKIKEGNTKGFSYLQVYRTIRGCQIRVIDLTSGHILYYKNFGNAIQADQVNEPDKLTDDEVAKHVSKMVSAMEKK